MEEDWGLNANAPPFSLIKTVTPQEAAAIDGWMNPSVYNRWKKAERKLYAKLKQQNIAKKIDQDEIKSMDDITSALESLKMIKEDDNFKETFEPTTQEAKTETSSIDDLISKVTELKINAERQDSRSSSSKQ